MSMEGMEEQGAEARDFSVFVYGSLMWDQWADALDGKRIDGAILTGYRRSFNKSSVERWGTNVAPGPTLGLEPGTEAKCIGTVFQFSGAKQGDVMTLLRKREGASFAFPELPVELPDGRSIVAVTPVNDRSKGTYIGALSVEKRAGMANVATGSAGNANAYARSLATKLKELGIVDQDVEDFVSALDKNLRP